MSKGCHTERKRRRGSVSIFCALTGTSLLNFCSASKDTHTAKIDPFGNFFTLELSTGRGVFLGFLPVAPVETSPVSPLPSLFLAG